MALQNSTRIAGLLCMAILASRVVPAISMAIRTADSTSTPPLRFFIGGLGYCGSRLAVRLRQEFPDCTISGCVRSETRRQSLLAANGKDLSNEHNVAVHVLDLDDHYIGLDEAGLGDLSRATHIVQTIAPIADFDRDPLLALHSKVLQGGDPEASPDSNLQWVGYLSSTGVYGDHSGDWVDEDSELRCQDAKSLARVKAEAEWRELETYRQRSQKATSTPTTRIDCFRCGGIYGPGRGPLDSALSMSKRSAIQDTTTNEEAPATTPKYVNRILVDDICGAIIAAVKANANAVTPASLPAGGATYNLVDDDPAPRRDVVEEANRLVRATIPSPDDDPAAPKDDTPTITAQIISGRRRPVSRNTGNKRCRNQRLKDDYAWKLLAPTYREGLRICLESALQS